MAAPERIVALGASNLTRGFQTVVSAARAAWGSNVEVLAALGHGRSYGARSTFLARGLPGILGCGLWPQLERLPAAATRALVTDVGNDILYGCSAERTLAWVAEAIDRLQRFTTDIVLTDLPMAGIRSLSEVRYLAVRTIVFPRCRLSLAQVRDAAERVNEGLVGLAAARRLSLVRLRESWYGVDPIHVRPSQWRSAWCEILAGGSGDAGSAPPSWRESALLYLRRAEREWLLGRERITPQPGSPLRARGSRVWLY